jgi:hypothetical protein
MGRFDGIDLSTDRSFVRIIRNAARARAEIITELADYLYQAGHHDAARLLQDKAREELNEVGL